MGEINQISFLEIKDIIEHSDKDIQNKIPLKFKKFIEEQCDGANNEVNIDYSGDILEQISKDAKTMMAIIYRDWLVSDEERKELLEYENSELAKYNEELKEKYEKQKEIMFETKNKATVKSEEINENFSLTVNVNKSVISKFVQFFKNLFKKND